MRRHFIILLTALAPCLSRPGMADVTSEFRDHAQKLHKSSIELEDIWYGMLSRLPDKGKCISTLDIDLKSVVEKQHDIKFRIYLIDGKPFRTVAWTPGWNRSEHELDILEYSITREDRRTVVELEIHVRLVFDGFTPMSGKDWNAWFTVTGELKGENVAGTYAATMPEDSKIKPDIKRARGKATGSLRGFGTHTKRIAEVPPPNTKTWSTYQAYRYCAQKGAEPDRHYQAIRAIAMSLIYDLPYTKTFWQAPAWGPRFDKYEPPSVKKKKAAPSLTDLGDDDDLGGLGGLDDDIGGPAATAKADDPTKDPNTAGALATLKNMNERAALMLEIARRCRKSGARFPPYEFTNGDRVEDPRFHPFYVTRAPLKIKGNSHVLPATAGSDGPMNWAPLTKWRYIGPFPVGEWFQHIPSGYTRNDPSQYYDWTSFIPALPAVITTPQDKLEPAMKPGHKKVRPFGGRGARMWRPLEAYNEYGYCAPPYCSGRNPVYGLRLASPGGKDCGMDFGAFIAETEVIAPRDMEVWAALGVHARGMVWLNDKLLWAGPSNWKRYWLAGGSAPAPDHLVESRLMLKLPFRKGKNKLRLRWEGGWSASFFVVRLCTQGKPGDPAESRAYAESIAKARRKLKPAVTGCNFRKDLTAYYKDTTPPVAWEIRRSHNIIWNTPLPYWANGSPVLTKDRVFVNTEPDKLYCLDKATGKILWKRHVNALDTLPEGDPDRVKGWEYYNQWWKARIERDKIPERVARLPKWIRYSNLYYFREKYEQPSKNEREGASPEMIALLDKKTELEANPDPASVQDELTKVTQDIEKLKAKELANDPEYRACMKWGTEASDARGKLTKILHKHLGIKGLQGYWQDHDGYMFSTPVTDGKHVWMKSGYGALACFDMDGNRKWLVAHGGGGSGSATIPSPMLVDGKIIVQLYYARAKTKVRHHVVAFDADTGKKLWEVPTDVTAWGAGSPIAVRLTNGKDQMAVMVTDGGKVIRADDGKVLAESIGLRNDSAIMVIHDDVIANAASMPMSAIKLGMIDRDTISFRTLWSIARASQYQSNVTDGEYLYMRGGAGVARADSEGWAGLTTIRMSDGMVVKTMPTFRKSGNGWCMNAATREHVYSYASGGLFVPSGNRAPSWIAVSERAADGDLLAINAFQRSYSCPIMEGERMYMRGYQGIVCIGYTGDAGRKYEATHIAQTLLDQVSGTRPRNAPTKKIKRASFQGQGYFAGRLTILNSGHAPAYWYFSGPHQDGNKPPLPKEVLVQGNWNSGKSAAGTGWKLNYLGVSGLGVTDPFPVRNKNIWEVCQNNCTLIDRERRRVIDLRNVVEPKPNTTCYMVASLHNRNAAGVYMYEQTLPGVRSWLNGTAIQSGDRVELEADRDRAGAYYTLVLEITLGDTVPDDLCISPRFWMCNDPAAAQKEWVRFVGKHEQRLRKAIDLAPQSLEAARAKAVLAQMK